MGLPRFQADLERLVPFLRAFVRPRMESKSLARLGEIAFSIKIESFVVSLIGKRP